MSRRQPGFCVQVFRQQIPALEPVRLQLGQAGPINPTLPRWLWLPGLRRPLLGLARLLLFLLLRSCLRAALLGLRLLLLGCLLLLGLVLPLVLLPQPRLLLA